MIAGQFRLMGIDGLDRADQLLAPRGVPIGGRRRFGLAGDMRHRRRDRLFPLRRDPVCLPSLDQAGGRVENDQKSQHGAPDGHALPNPRLEGLWEHPINGPIFAWSQDSEGMVNNLL
jgi:hypothetical protein